MSLESHALPSNAAGGTRPESLTRTSAEIQAVDPRADSVVERRQPGSGRLSAAHSTGEPVAKLTAGSLIPHTRLEIVRWLGEGGMGTVFEVRHLDIDRHFAAKLLHRSESVARARRFRREAKTIGNIGSPWVVEIFDFKELPDGRLLYLMELVNGPSLLARYLERGALDLGQLIALARQICKGLADAHSQGFVHRDIKPENLMLATDPDGRERVKIVDFGLAGLLAEPNESSRAGTPTYMSPEQCTGEPSDARADIYAFGVTLYELGTGTLPFVRNDAEALREDHVNKQPIPPSKLGDGPPLPASFDALVLRCLAKRPGDRFADAGEVEAALIELQIELGLRTDWDDLPAPLVDEPRRRRLEHGLAALRHDRERERSRRMLLGVALATLIAASSAIGWWIGGQRRAEMVAHREAELVELHGDVHEAVDARRWIYPTVGQPDAESAYALLLQIEALDVERAEQVGRALREEIAAQLLAYGDAYWDAPGGRGFAREFYAHVLVFEPEHARALERAKLSPTAVESLRERAATGEFDPSELAAIQTLPALAELDAEQRLAALVAMAADADQLPTSVAISLDQLIDELERQLPNRVTRAERVDSSPRSTVPQGPDPALANALETEPIVASKSDSELDHNARAEAAELAKLGNSEFALGRRAAAERLYQKALELDSKTLDALIGLHRLHFDRGQFKDALTYSKRAVLIRPKRGDLHVDVGDSCMKVLDYTCARRHYDKAATLRDPQAQQRLEMLDQRVGTTP